MFLIVCKDPAVVYFTSQMEPVPLQVYDWFKFKVFHL